MDTSASSAADLAGTTTVAVSQSLENPQQKPLPLEMARAPMTPTNAPPTDDDHHNRGSVLGAATNAPATMKMRGKQDDVVSPLDTEIDEVIDDDTGSMLDSDGELGTPLGVGAPAGFGDFDDEEFASHRFLGPSVAGDASSARALHGLRRVMVHAKPPKFASDLSAMRASITCRTSSAASTEFAGSVRSYSLEQPLNSYQVTFSDNKPTGFTTRLSFSDETAELAVRIAAVERDSPAFKAGIVVGDTLLSVNDNPIEPHMTEDQVEELMASQRGARTIVFARQCVDSPEFPYRKSSSRSSSEGKDTIVSESILKKPGNGRFSKAKSALSYGGSLMAAKLKRKKSIVHKGIMCEGCGVDSIVGALWSCSVCPNYNLCNDCYEVGTHGMENTEAMQALNEALVQFRLMKKCKRFTPEFMLSLRRDICKNRPDKFEYMGGWIADIVNGTAPSKITVRGIEIPHLPPTSRQRFVGKLMPLVSNRTDIEVHIEWLPDDAERASMDLSTLDVGRGSGSCPQEDLEKLRIWISDKKTRTASPFG